MSKELSNELRAKIATLALNYSYAYGEEWESSSKIMQDELTARGITDIKVFYEYKMPGGISQTAYMVKLAYYLLFVDFDLYNSHKDFITDFQNAIKDDATRLQVIDYIKDETPLYNQKLTNDCDELIKLNPELSVITDRSTHRDDILWGAVFGIAPDDIEFFCNGQYHPDIRTNEAEQKVFRKQLNSYGFSRVGILNPEKAKQLIYALEKSKQSAMMETGNGRK